MNKAHYKYIEIKRRAEFFLKTFTEYYDLYPDFWPEKYEFPEAFKELIEYTMIARMPLKESLLKVSSGGYQIASYRNRQITQILADMKASKDSHVIDLYELILEFDRWNNFRILPPKCQEPSAFERRNKTRELKYIRRLAKLPEFTIAKLRERYEYKGSHKKLYVIILSKHLPSYFLVMGIKDIDKHVSEMSRLGLFVFNDYDKAYKFALLVAEYLFRDAPKKANYGQRFWPDYRVQVKGAINFKAIYQIITTKTYLENAYIDMNLLKVRNRDKEKASSGAKPLTQSEAISMF